MCALPHNCSSALNETKVCEGTNPPKLCAECDKGFILEKNNTCSLAMCRGGNFCKKAATGIGCEPPSKVGASAFNTDNPLVVASGVPLKCIECEANYQLNNETKKCEAIPCKKGYNSVPGKGCEVAKCLVPANCAVGAEKIVQCEGDSPPKMCTKCRPGYNIVKGLAPEKSGDEALPGVGNFCDLARCKKGPYEGREELHADGGTISGKLV